MAHVSEQKKQTVAEFTELIDKYDIVGAVNMENLPAKTLHTMREKLRDTVLIKMTKSRLLKVALEQSKKEGATKLVEHMKGMPALLFTNSSPFTLYKTLKKNKSKTGIKGGQTAPNDIVVPAGPTSFAPGPVIGELGAVGIKAGIDGGKVAIKADSKVAVNCSLNSLNFSKASCSFALSSSISFDLSRTSSWCSCESEAIS
jgi:large subunit ribosomal protein L10